MHTNIETVVTIKMSEKEARNLLTALQKLGVGTEASYGAHFGSAILLLKQLSERLPD